jgi:Flp pilus assembly protein CpaB
MVALTKGMRAVAVTIGDPLRKARILKMGDAVDVIFHFTIPQGSIAITLFQRVVVIDQRDEIAVLMLTPDQAEELAFAQAHGQAMLALRNREDTEQKELKQVTFPNLLKGSIDLRLTPAIATPVHGGKVEFQQLLDKVKNSRSK